MIYVLHFERPLHHARHYVGYAKSDVARRVHEHLTGTGAHPSPLVRAVVAAGIGVELADAVERGDWADAHLNIDNHHVDKLRRAGEPYAGKDLVGRTATLRLRRPRP